VFGVAVIGLQYFDIQTITPCSDWSDYNQSRLDTAFGGVCGWASV
jgi:hypothetical protein